MSAEVAGAVPVVTIEVTAPTGTAADDAPSAQHDEAQHDTVALRPHEGPSSPGDARRWSMLLPSWMAFGRRKALAELIATEERYVSDLRALVEGYLNRLPTEVSWRGVSLRSRRTGVYSDTVGRESTREGG